MIEPIADVVSDESHFLEDVEDSYISLQAANTPRMSILILPLFTDNPALAVLHNAKKEWVVSRIFVHA
jgi:hypothetical protein